MELSKAIASIAVVLGVILAAGYAQGEASEPASGATRPTAQERLEKREAERRAAVQEQERRRIAYERACNKPLNSESDREMCRTAYKRLHLK
jgi:hypothetical protein